MLEIVSSVVWIVVHVAGALVMLLAWRRYRQPFFPWSSVKWASQACVVWLAPMHGPLLVCVRLTGAFTGVVAMYYVLRMMQRQRRFVTVLAEKDGRALLRRGFDNHVQEIPPAVCDVDEDAIDTPRPNGRA